MAYQDDVLALNPAAYWRMEATAGPTVVDGSGNGHDGTWRTGADPVFSLPGLHPDSGDCVGFTGEGFDVPTTLAAALAGGPYTLETWLHPDPYPTADNNNDILFEFRSTGGSPIFMPYTSETGNLRLGHNGTFDYSQATLSDSAPTLFVATVDASEVVYYVNGSPVWSIADDCRLAGTETCAPGRGFHGRMDEIVVYPFAMDAAAIKERYLGLAWADRFTRQIPSAASVYIAAPIPPENYTVDSRVLAARTFSGADQIFGGPGRITGQVTDKDNLPLARRVLLLDRRTNLVVRSTLSEPDGSYEFDWLDDRQYTLLAHDYTAQYNAVVEDNVRPEIPAGRWRD